MNRDARFRRVWLALAGAFLCIPAHADVCQYDGLAFCSTVLNIDSSGNIAGYSITELPFMEGMFGIVSATEGYVEGPSGMIADVWSIDYANEGWAESDTSGRASVSGSYSQFGYHWELPYWDSPQEGVQVGATEGDWQYSALSCLPPDGEYSSYDSTLPAGSTTQGVPTWGTKFHADLYGDGEYLDGTTVWESVTQDIPPGSMGSDVYDGCWWPGDRQGPYSFIFSGNAPPWTVYAGSYGQDTIASAGAPGYYQGQMQNQATPYDSCTLFLSTQVMFHSCTGEPYHTNMLSFWVTPFYMTAYRDNASGPAQ